MSTSILPKSLVLWGLLAACMPGASAKDVDVSQKDKKFSVKKLSLSVGDSINFKNEDPFAHNIMSLSDAKMFDLGSFGQGQSKKVVFDAPGTVEVECAIHPEMTLVVEVKK